MTYFWSGSNRAGEIRALDECGVPIGVTVDAMDKAGRSLAELKKTSVPVFIDSGAFGEVQFSINTFNFEIKKEITHRDWQDRLALYKKITIALPGRCYVVAPDQVGSQEGTISRLERYKQEVNELIELGARVIVPLQKGVLSQEEFDMYVQAILGHTHYIRGIPSKKAAATTEEIAALSRALPQDAELHLLGLGPWGKRFKEIIPSIQQRVISCDSCRIIALVGTNRPLTRWVNKIREELGYQDKGRLSAEESCVVKYRSLKGYIMEAGLCKPSTLLDL